jgi:hypothetical protein
VRSYRFLLLQHLLRHGYSISHSGSCSTIRKIKILNQNNTSKSLFFAAKRKRRRRGRSASREARLQRDRNCGFSTGHYTPWTTFCVSRIGEDGGRRVLFLQMAFCFTLPQNYIIQLWNAEPTVFVNWLTTSCECLSCISSWLLFLGGGWSGSNWLQRDFKKKSGYHNLLATKFLILYV